MNRLPSEVLASCATFVSDTDPRQIVSLTHVCRYWRKSISSDPRSWASISTGWRRLVPLCLERAGAVPLAVDIAVSDIGDGGGFLEPLLPHTSRIDHLCLTGYTSIEAMANDLPGFFDSAMPNLTSLELQQATEPTNLFPPIEASVPPVFQNVAKLESLCLTRTPLYSTLFSIASLKELKLIGYKNLFNFGTFIGLLRSNIDLERVVLDIQFVADSVRIPRGRITVPLSRLQHLSITCSRPIDSKGLLSYISLPHGAHVEVTSTLSDQSARLDSFLPSPPMPIRELLAPITTVKSQLDPRELHLFGNGSVFTFRTTQSASNGPSEWTLFPTTAVREFHTDARPLYLDAFLSRVMGRLPALEVLAISRAEFPVGLLSALTEEPVLCPALKTIAFFDCNIDSNTIKQLGKAIAKRRDSTAARLHRVVIVSSTGTPLGVASIRQLRESIPCVEVRVDDKLPDLL